MVCQILEISKRARLINYFWLFSANQVRSHCFVNGAHGLLISNAKTRCDWNVALTCESTGNLQASFFLTDQPPSPWSSSTCTKSDFHNYLMIEFIQKTWKTYQNSLSEVGSPIACALAWAELYHRAEPTESTLEISPLKVDESVEVNCTGTSW